MLLLINREVRASLIKSSDTGMLPVNFSSQGGVNGKKEMWCIARLPLLQNKECKEMKSRILIVRQFIILILLLSSALGCATIQRNIAESNARQREQNERDQQQREEDNARLKSACPNIELMGLFTKDMRPMTSTNEIGAGQIVTTQLSANSPRDRQPINLRITSCRWEHQWRILSTIESVRTGSCKVANMRVENMAATINGWFA